MAFCSFVTSIHVLYIDSDGTYTYKITIYNIDGKYLFPLIYKFNKNINLGATFIKIKNTCTEIIKANIIFYIYFSSKEMDLIFNLKIDEFITLNTFNQKKLENFPIPLRENNYTNLLFCTYDAYIEKRKQIKDIAI
jgi:hypothetical protein